MFGYIRVNSGELKVKEYDLYKAVYCGLCRAMKGRIKCFSELTLSYDFVFLALLAISWNREEIVLEARRCIAHPTKKRPMLALSPSLEKTAALSAVLTHYKIADDLHDSRFVKKLPAAMLIPFTSAMKKKANIDKSIEDNIQTQLSRLSELETKKCASPDSAAQVFGELLGDIFKASVYGETEKRLAYECGLGAGRWIYLVDAVDDYVKDVKEKNYNPFAEVGIGDYPTLKTSLILELKRIETSVMLTDFADDGIKNIIYNIIYMGMPDTSENIIVKALKECSENKEK